MGVNIQPMSASKALAALREGWNMQSAGDLTASWMLHGRPGVGKSEIVATLARDIGARLFDLRLTTIEPQDLRGLPYYDHEAKKTVWYRPEDLPDDPASPSILFLDELTAAPAMLQPVVYGLLQERRVGQHELPGSVFVVAAGNSADDGAVAYDLGTALSDRLLHIRIEASATDWIENVALARDFDPSVTAFIRARPDLLETTEAALGMGDTVFATPRSWERVSALMTSVRDRRLRARLIEGTLGAAVAAEFQLVADEIAGALAVDDLLAAPQGRRAALYPASLHGLHALVYALAAKLETETVTPVIETLSGLATLDATRSEEVFTRLPLRELTTHGFEVLIRKGLDKGLGEAMLAVPEMAAHMAARDDDGAP